MTEQIFTLNGVLTYRDEGQVEVFNSASLPGGSSDSLHSAQLSPLSAVLPTVATAVLRGGGYFARAMGLEWKLL